MRSVEPSSDVQDQLRSLRCKCAIVVPVLPRWVTDFNVVSSSLTDAGWDVEIFYPKPSRSKSGWESHDTVCDAKFELNPLIKTTEMPLQLHVKQFQVLSWIRSIVQAMSAARKRQYDYFILWSAMPTALWGPWLRLFGCNALFLITGLGRNFGHTRRGGLRHKFVCMLYRFILSGKTSRIIVHNKEDKQELVNSVKVDANRITVTGGCGVDPSKFSFNHTRLRFSDRPTILVPSRILRDKGTLDAARASKILSNRNFRHRMVFTSHPVIGRGDALNADELAEAKSAPDVEFIGYQKDIRSSYRSADIVCLPSWYREGLQTAILEAAAMGKPMVVCDNVGVRDFVRPKVDALVVPPRSPEALADKIEEMLSSPEAAEEMRVNARDRFLTGFTKAHMLAVTQKVIFDALKQ